MVNFLPQMTSRPSHHVLRVILSFRDFINWYYCSDNRKETKKPLKISVAETGSIGAGVTNGIVLVAHFYLFRKTVKQPEDCYSHHERSYSLQMPLMRGGLRKLMLILVPCMMSRFFRIQRSSGHRNVDWRCSPIEQMYLILRSLVSSQI
jgi:hypothetical protein